VTAKQALLMVWRILMTACMVVIIILLWEQQPKPKSIAGQMPSSVIPSNESIPSAAGGTGQSDTSFENQGPNSREKLSIFDELLNDDEPLQPPALPSLAPMLNDALPAVVSISTVSFSEDSTRQPSFFGYLNGTFRDNNRRSTYGLGSGIIIDAKEGYVITSHHVIQGATQITVTLSDKRELPARVLGTDPDTDIAVLQIKNERLSDIPLADSDQLAVGDFVVAIGNPFGLGHSVSLGIVSAKGRYGIGNGIENLIQTDAPINQGNSGGGLVDIHGQLVGMSTLIYSSGEGGGNIGIGFAIPSNMVASIADQLIEYGAVQRTLFGVTVVPLNDELRARFGIGPIDGAIVTDVANDSVAQITGIKPGDIIVRINDQDIDNAKALRNAVGLLLAGDHFTIEVQRNSEIIIFEAQLPEPAPSDMPGDALHPLLMGAEFMDSPDHGVEITNIAHGTPAWRAKLRPADRILAVGEQPVKNLMSLREALMTSPKTIQLVVQSGSQVYNVTIE
jgi:Do/DeqQ family serine protease